MRSAGLVIVAVLGGCGSPEQISNISDWTLRISTSAGLEPVSPGLTSSFSASLIDLVFETGDRHFSKVVKANGHWHLVPSAGQAVDAGALWHPRLFSARAAGNGVDVELKPGPDPDLGEFRVDVGPFEQESYSESKLVLRRRTSGVPQRIEIVRARSEDEEWRRFLAREVDLVPVLSPAALEYIKEVPSVRIVPFRRAETVSLFFRVDSDSVRDAAVRRFIARRLRRPAIAQLATGDPRLALPPTWALEPESPPRMHTTFRLIFHEGSWDHERAVLVLEQQLAELGYDASVRALTVDALVRAVADGGFDGWVFGGGFQQMSWLTTGHPGNIPRYANPELDAAISNRRVEQARQLLERDVPFTPLFVVRHAVAVDQRICGVHPVAGDDLRWLADVHPCAEGETE